MTRLRELAEAHALDDAALRARLADGDPVDAEGWSTLSWDNGATRDTVAALRDHLRALLDGAPAA